MTNSMSQQTLQNPVTGTKRKRSSSDTTPVEMPLVNATFRWAELSTELKLEVLKHALIFCRPITPHVHLTRTMNRLLPLALTNKDMCIMTMEMYYTKNHFIAQTVRYSNPMHNLSYPNPMVGHWIQELTLKLSFLSHPNDDFEKRDIFSMNSEWKFLLDDNRGHGGSSPSAEWYNKLKLNKLKVIIEFADGNCFMGRPMRVRCSCHYRQIVRLHFNGTRIAAKAKKYIFEVTGMHCMREDGTSSCHGACSKIIEDCLYDLLTEK